MFLPVPFLAKRKLFWLLSFFGKLLSSQSKSKVKESEDYWILILSWGSSAGHFVFTHQVRLERARIGFDGKQLFWMAGPFWLSTVMSVMNWQESEEPLTVWVRLVLWLCCSVAHRKFHGHVGWERLATDRSIAILWARKGCGRRKV